MQTHTLTRADIETHDPEGGKGGRWLCPLPECSGHTDPRRHRSLSLAPDTGLWNCHRCHAQGQLKDRWKPLEYKSPKEKKQEADTRRRVGLAKILAKAKGEDEKEHVCPDRFRLGTLECLQSSPAARAYLEGRGFTQDALELLSRSGVRFAPDFGRRLATETAKGSRGTPSIVFPLRDKEGKLIASQGRFLTPWPSGQKFLTLGDKNAGTFATHGALEALQKGQPVAIVEAPFDALTLALAGIPTLALCGSAGAPEWLTRRAFGRRFLLAFDADNAGDEAAATLGAELGTLGAIVERLRPEGAKDFNDLLKAGGEPWTRTAEALRARMAREAKATTGPGEPPDEAQEDRGEESGKPAENRRNKNSPPGSWRSPDRIAQEKLFYRLAVGELIASWDPGKPLHQGSVLQDPKRWLEEKYYAYSTIWHQAEESKDPALEAEREALFSEALAVIFQARAICSSLSTPRERDSNP